jgi:hypothetical protein
MGHLMGGHGALTLYLKGVVGSKVHGGKRFCANYESGQVPVGEKVFKGYLKVREIV